MVGHGGLARSPDAVESRLLDGQRRRCLPSVRPQLEDALPLQEGVCVVAAEALRVLAHVAALGARLRRRDEVREDALVASDRSLENRQRERMNGLGNVD